MKSKSGSVFVNVILVFFLILLIVNYIRFAMGSENYVSFTGLLELLTNTSSFQFESITIFNDITADWGLFNFFRDFLNTLGAFTNLSWFIITNLINSLIFVTRLVMALFFV